MNNDKTVTTEPTALNEVELDSAQGGAGRINLDSFISVLNADTLRNQAGLARPKGIDVRTDIPNLSLNLGNLSSVGNVRGV